MLDLDLTIEEISAIKKYQDNNFKIYNSLLREGIESEFIINSLNGKDYPFMTRSLMEQYLIDINNIYSAILKSYKKNGGIQNKLIFRGTKQSIISSMNDKNNSFLSASTNINTTLTFSRTFKKGSGNADISDRAILLIKGEVPCMNIENELGGFEDEFLFVPSKVHIIEKEFVANLNYGKEYIAYLSEIDIRVKTLEEIELLKENILENTEKMSEYLKYILEIKSNDDSNIPEKVTSLIKEYSNWKNLVIEYNYQQYRILKEKYLVNQYYDENNHNNVFK